MSNSSRKNRNRPMSNRRAQATPPAATLDEAYMFAVEEFADKVAALPAARGVVDLGSTAADRTPRSGRPIGLAPLIADALDELVPADGGPDGVPIGVALADAGCVGIPHSSVFNPVTEYVRKQVPNLDTVFTTATEIVAERGDIRARVTLPEYVADFLLTYDTVDDAFPALVMATGPASVELREEAAAA